MSEQPNNKYFELNKNIRYTLQAHSQCIKWAMAILFCTIRNHNKTRLFYE